MVLTVLLLAIAFNVVFILIEVFPSIFKKKYHRAAVDIYLRDEYEVVGSASDNTMKLWILKNDIDEDKMAVITKYYEPSLSEWEFHIYMNNDENSVMLFSSVDPMARKIIKKLKPVVEEYERKNSLQS